jgi:hypothetical protein
VVFTLNNVSKQAERDQFATAQRMGKIRRSGQQTASARKASQIDKPGAGASLARRLAFFLILTPAIAISWHLLRHHTRVNPEAVQGVSGQGLGFAPTATKTNRAPSSQPAGRL